MIVTPSRLALALAGLGVPAVLLAAGVGAHAGTRPTPTPRAHAAPLVARVAIAGYAFRPKTLTVAPGTRVTWTNTDSDTHTVVSDTTVFTASDDLHRGKSFTHTFATVGTYTYHCGQHAFMTGTIIVKRVKR
jgi:plastocyanin